jgi:hypothetical protein
MTTLPLPQTPRAVLAEVAALAADHGWAAVTEFAAAVPAPDSRDVAILAAEGTVPGPLAALAAVQAGAVGGGQESPADGSMATSAAVLEPLATQPWLALPPNRVLVVLRCGQLLAADTAAAAAAVLQRPAGTYRIALTGAEDLESAADLATVERGLWRVLLAPDGAAWHGQDISAHGCLLWSDRDVAAPITGRVARDVASLRQWLAGPAAVPPDLDRDRAACAVSLATSALDEQQQAAAAAAPATATATADARRLADLASQVRGLHDRLLVRLTADAETTERQVLASLQVLEQDLVAAGPAGRTLPPDHARRAVEQWAAETEQVVVQRYRSGADQARHLLDRVDWDLVNRVAPHPGGHRYPRVLVAPIAPSASGTLPPGAIAAGDAATAAGPETGSAPDRGSVLGGVSPGALVTAGVGAAALGLLGLPLLPVAGAAALAVVGGSLYESRHRGDEERKRAQQLARATVPGAIANAVSLTRGALSDQASAVGAAVDAEFTTLERSLDQCAARARQDASGPEADACADGGQLRPRLAALLSQLAAG